MAGRTLRVVSFDIVSGTDVALVGGKNASRGKTISEFGRRRSGCRLAFAPTTAAYWNFVEATSLKNDLTRAFAEFSAGRPTFSEIGQSSRRAIVQGEWPEETVQSIATAYAELCHRTGAERVNRDVRSCAKAENLPDASFAALAFRDAPAQA